MKNNLLSLSILILFFTNVSAQSGTKISKNILKSTNKPVLVEYFTQASCYYCGLYDPTLEKTITQDEDFVMAIAYHTSWPGVDPMQNAVNQTDCNDRVIFYKVTGVPKAFTDGTESDGLLSGVLPATNQDTVFEIQNPNVKLIGNTLTYSADIVADSNKSGNISGFVVVIEQEIDFISAPGSNGQTHFPWVMRKMCPSGEGNPLPYSMKIGQKKTLSGSWTLSNIYDNKQLRVIFFVQNLTTHEVYWATMVNATTGIHEDSNISSINIFPNPAKNKTTVYFDLEKPEVINIHISNLLGQEVISKSPGLISAGKNQYALNLDNLQAGSYIIEVKTQTGSITRKLTVIK